jgi:hypothetical protein
LLGSLLVEFRREGLELGVGRHALHELVGDVALDVRVGGNCADVGDEFADLVEPAIDRRARRAARQDFELLIQAEGWTQGELLIYRACRNLKAALAMAARAMSGSVSPGSWTETPRSSAWASSMWAA